MLNNVVVALAEAFAADGFAVLNLIFAGWAAVRALCRGHWGAGRCQGSPDMASAQPG